MGANARSREPVIFQETRPEHFPPREIVVHNSPARAQEDGVINVDLTSHLVAT